MISAPKDNDAHLPSAWTAGIAALFLVIGLQGAVQPLLPSLPTQLQTLDLGTEVMVESFSPPPAPGEAPSLEPETAEAEPLVEPLEIPPLPVLATPLTPPEMTELIPLQPVALAPEPEKPQPKPKPVTEPRPAKPTSTSSAPTSSSSSRTKAAGAPGGTGTSPSSGGSKRGSFPEPYYPSAARAAGLQGTVKLRVFVEANGSPSSVSIVASSGHPVLDTAARDHVQRRWRWPAGSARAYSVPVRYVLE